MGHIPAEMAHSSGNVWPGAVGSVHELPHKLGVRELLEVKDVIIVLSRCVLCCHGGTNGLAVGHTKVVEDVRDVLSLAKLKGTFGSVPPDAASKQPSGWSKLLNLELAGEVGFEFPDEVAFLADDDTVVQVHAEDVHVAIVVDGVDAGVNFALLESVLDEPVSHTVVPGTRSLLDTVERASQLADVLCSIKGVLLVPLGLTHKNRLLYVGVEVGRDDVELVHFEVVRTGQCE